MTTTPLVLARGVVAAGVALVLVVGACSGDDDGGDGRAASTTATTAAPSTSVRPGPGALAEVELAAERVATVDTPTALAARPGTDDLYVTEQAGRVRRIEVTVDAEGTRTERLVPEPVLDLTSIVRSGGEQGLLGIAFSSDGRVLYLFLNRDPDGHTELRSYPLGEGTSIDPDSGRVLLRIEKRFPNHNGGQLALGPDGFLYLGLGDGGGGDDPDGHGQDTDQLLGKLLRIDPSGADPTDDPPYAIPADNPFARSGGRPEIWATGLRNPWRFSFDRANGDLWIADVGQGEWEEIDHLPAAGPAGATGAGRGANLGWDRMEGSHPHEGGTGGTDGGGPGGTGGTGGPGGTGGTGGTTTGGRSTGGGGGLQPCPGGRAKQVPGDPYSPPCYAFSGDNGGSTSKGVTKDAITVAVRQLEGPSAAEIFASISGQSVNDSPQAYADTVLALADYFNSRFQFYGRKIKIAFFKGDGSGADELLGGGKEKALSDAVKSAKEIGAFADLSGITIPYADALARQGVVNIGAPYPSSEWFTARRPYTWSLFPDGTNVVRSSVSSMLAGFPPNSPAEFGGASVNGKPRKVAIVAPENSEYQQSVNAAIDILQRNGIQISLNLKYKLDISSMPNQASNIVAQLKNAGITTIMAACDPVMLALGLTPKANEQGYEPEWLTAGLAFVDQDIVSQLIDTRQWRHAFGIAYNAESEPQGRSFPYAAYKQIRPHDEPAFGVEELYYQMYILAIGLQMAGPNLTPQTFEAGMFAYPGGSGPRGTWHFGPGDYTPTDDFRQIWWDPNRISGQNNQAGAWVQLGGGRRFTPQSVPKGTPAYFKEG